MARKTYRAKRSFSLEMQGLFVEGSVTEFEVAEMPTSSRLPFMTPWREEELLEEGRIELVVPEKAKTRAEVSDG